LRSVVVIPARYASQRLPAKPLADILGKSMIQHVYERAHRATSVERVLVATDDERIVAAVEAFGGEAIMTPAVLQSGSDRVAYVARELSDVDLIVNVQGDEPLLAPEMIDEAVKVLIGDPEPVVSTLAQKIEVSEELFNPNVVKVVLDTDGNCLYFSRSPIPFGRDRDQTDWLSRHIYFKHVGLYVFRREFLTRFTSLQQSPLELMEKLEQLRILEHGYKIKAAVTRYDSIPVDTPADLEKVRALLQNMS
jgi:3-deoxy-manno-octulosonate cytidylyltransferase (CMP-KDO synthetase)